MNLPAHVDLVKLLVASHERAVDGELVVVGNVPPSSASISADRFTSPDRFALERTRLFARVPSIVALEHDVAAEGACVVVDVAGVSCLVVRGKDGVVRGFKNACRHRGTQLVDPSTHTCTLKNAIACPYHAWTYDLDGRLAHVPHRDAFAGLEAGRDLVPIHVVVRHGFVFAALDAFDVDAHIAPIADDLALFAAESRVVHAHTTRDVKANWKLLVDAFLDGYHIRVLHRDSVGRFFADGVLGADRVGLHVRAVTARKTLFDVRNPASINDDVDLRAVATPSYLVFPSTILILHPDYTSVMRIVPVAVDRTRFEHVMLTRTSPKNDAEQDHFDKSFALIDGGVFAKEDLVIVERIQRGLATGASNDVVYGDLESASLWFHADVDRIVTAEATR